jgi:hypothetical protein
MTDWRSSVAEDVGAVTAETRFKARKGTAARMGDGAVGKNEQAVIIASCYEAC